MDDKLRKLFPSKMARLEFMAYWDTPGIGGCGHKPTRIIIEAFLAGMDCAPTKQQTQNEICSHDICDYCTGCDAYSRCNHYSEFRGRKLSFVR